MTKRRTIPSYAVPGDAPIGEMNTTPLIDVMLVLLIMFIVTVPIASHKVPLDLPQGPPPERVEPVVHRLMLGADGRVSLNGAPVSDAQLPARLARIAAEQGSVLELHTAGEARYERFDQLLAAIKRAGIERMGMAGNERFVSAVR